MSRIGASLYEFEPLQKASNFVLANLLWITFSIPLITLPAATAGLFTTFSLWVRRKSVSVFPDFFEGMKQHWKKSTLIGVMDLSIGGIITANLLILYSMELPWIPAILSLSVTLALMLLTFLVNLYIWPSIVVFDLPFRQLIGTSISMVFKHPWCTLLTFGSVLMIMGVSIFFLPRFILVFVTFSSCALIMCWGHWRVARRYLEADELARLEAPKG